jgi:hypothetical protein
MLRGGAVEAAGCMISKLDKYGMFERSLASFELAW